MFVQKVLHSGLKCISMIKNVIIRILIQA